MTTELTTVDDVKAWLSITSSNQDALFTRLVTAASAFIESWLSRTIGVASYTGVFNGTDGVQLFLPNRPVTAVTSVTINTTAISEAADAVSAGYVWDEMGIYLRGYVFERGIRNITVVYSAGLAASAPTDVPADIQQACIELIALKYRRMGDEGMASKALQGETVSFVVSDMPKPVMTLLKQYRNTVPA